LRITHLPERAGTATPTGWAKAAPATACHSSEGVRRGDCPRGKRRTPGRDRAGREPRAGYSLSSSVSQ